jgi:cell wall-associated NlpC family hydrolase
MAAPGLGNWTNMLAGEIGVPMSPGLNTFMNLWTRAEGGGATNNPFNTTQPGFGATGDYNSVGVKNYADPGMGIKATAATLKNGRYGNILAAMRTGDPHAMAQALAASPWGTGALVLKMLGGGGGAMSPPPSTPTSGSAAIQTTPPPGTSFSLTGKRPPSMSQILAQAAPSSEMVNLLSQISPMAGRAAKAAQAPIPLPQLPNKVTPQAMVGVNPTNKSHVAAVNLVKQYLGTPYVWGGSHPGGFDCSGLVQYTLGKEGISVPRTTFEQFQTGQPVGKKNLKPGDAVFFEPSFKGPQHEGMYIGNGQFIEAPHTGAVVRISNLAGRTDYVGARRFS